MNYNTGFGAQGLNMPVPSGGLSVAAMNAISTAAYCSGVGLNYPGNGCYLTNYGSGNGSGFLGAVSNGNGNPSSFTAVAVTSLPLTFADNKPGFVPVKVGGVFGLLATIILQEQSSHALSMTTGGGVCITYDVWSIDDFGNISQRSESICPM